ncbi:hypothetical protein SAMN04487944_111117 [Gracilibacillus ureilyticus]|uniref:Uncharacterized protein n=1 Tax=Gracilibacillus ureilyticus TaxID=531814 RepID=A0A1H9SP01_9BACI|nr:hypothetical protein [Gracilibacillus ureilyticus]SER86696.1 hypothetical protein SAMN04487944_111117 [Gracilibacillus ureilyticus]
MIYALFFLLGFGFAISGGMSIILYLNFIPAGLSFIDYLSIIQSKMECYFFIVGLVMMGISLNKLTVMSVK